jgi:hypothetical protein
MLSKKAGASFISALLADIISDAISVTQSCNEKANGHDCPRPSQLKGMPVAVRKAAIICAIHLATASMLSFGKVDAAAVAKFRASAFHVHLLLLVNCNK